MMIHGVNRAGGKAELGETSLSLREAPYSVATVVDRQLNEHSGAFRQSASRAFQHLSLESSSIKLDQ